MLNRSGLVPERVETSQMNQSKATIEEVRKKGVRRTVTVFGAIAIGIFLLSLLQGLKYS
jgi:hypothetical protein